MFSKLACSPGPAGSKIITPPRIQDTSPWACSWEVPRNDRPPQPDTHTQSCGNSPSCPLFSMVSVPTKLEVFCFMRVVCIYTHIRIALCICAYYAFSLLSFPQCPTLFIVLSVAPWILLGPVRAQAKALVAIY